MKSNDKNAQLEVLNRFSDMLDEYSVQYLAEQDHGFKQFVTRLNETVNSQAHSLLRS